MYKGRNGGWLTQSLFWEKWSQLAPVNRHCNPVFSFRPRPGMIDCKSTFVEVGDPTGYKWAMLYLESYDHWLALLERKWFSDEVAEWQNELNAKIKANALQRINDISSCENAATALAAAKYLAERGWEKSSAGRPSKERLAGELKKLTQDAEDTNQDFNRLGLTVVQGGKN